MATLADRIKKLERDERTLRAQLAGDIGSPTALTHTRRYLDQVTATLDAVRARQARRQRIAAGVAARLRLRTAGASPAPRRQISGFAPSRVSPAPVGHFALALPVVSGFSRTEDTELVTTWHGAAWRVA